MRPLVMTKHGCADGRCPYCLQRMPISERFLYYVVKTPTCHRWLGHTTKDGYGRISVLGRQCLAHRVAYELWVGAIPEGLTIDHLCGNVWCVNPAHLEAVSIRTNVLRGSGIPVQNAMKTHCPRGHTYDNVYTVYGKVARRCRQCKNAQNRKYKAQARAAREAAALPPPNTGGPSL